VGEVSGVNGGQLVVEFRWCGLGCYSSEMVIPVLGAQTMDCADGWRQSVNKDPNVVERRDNW
jgi:hypothetical protein